MIDNNKIVAYYIARKEVTTTTEVTDVEVVLDDLDEEVDLPITDDTIIEEE